MNGLPQISTDLHGIYILIRANPREFGATISFSDRWLEGERGLEKDPTPN